MRVAIAADHAGFELKQRLAERMRGRGDVEVLDLGPTDASSVDYPDFARAVAEAVRDARAERGILVCGSGIGMCIAANKVAEVRAALAHDEYTARMARAHNDANVLCLGSRVVTDAIADAALEAFLTTPFEGGRHAARVAKIHAREPGGGGA